MPIKTNTKEEIIITVITLLFILGFFILNINSITGMAISDFSIKDLAQGSIYNLRMYTLGLQANKAEGETYEARILLTAFQPGTTDAQGNTYSANIGFFSAPSEEEAAVSPVSKEVVKGGSSSGVGERKSSTITETIQTITGNVYTIDSLIPGETELNITDPGLSVIKIILNSAKEAKDIEIFIEEKRNTKLQKPNKRVYRYMTIETNMPESFLNKIKIIFKINKGWSSDIKLLRYTNSWKELETKKIYVDNKYYDSYEAISPGFSTFAITGKPIIEEIKEKAEEFKGRIKRIIGKPTKKELFVMIGIPAIILCIIALLLISFFVKLIKKMK